MRFVFVVSALLLVATLGLAQPLESNDTSPVLEKRRPRGLNRRFVREFMDQLNYYRELHGVRPLRHSKSLDPAAQDWADYKAERKNTRPDETELGQIVYERKDTDDFTLTGPQVVDYWYKRGKNYPYGRKPRHMLRFSQFTELIWASNEEVGIGLAYTSDRRYNYAYVVANFAPGGNVKGEYRDNVFPPKDDNNKDEDDDDNDDDNDDDDDDYSRFRPFPIDDQEYDEEEDHNID